MNTSFAINYQTEDVLKKPYYRYREMYEALYMEGKFMTAGIGYDDVSGLTYDGYSIDPVSLLPFGSPRAWSSPSKEALHLHALALFLNNNSLAQHMFSASHSETQEVLTLLEKKLASYTSFNSRYPGFGRFLPWFVIVDGVVHPASDWASRLPAVDNGMYFWSIYHMYNALVDYTSGSLPEEISYRAIALRDGFSNILTNQKGNLATIFYEGSGKVRQVALISNTSQIPEVALYKMEGSATVNDTYDGELITMAMDLFSTLGKTDKREIWSAKSLMLQQTSFTVQNGTLNAQKGRYSSAHELWKFLILPYRDITEAASALQNTVKSYTWYSSMNNHRGLWTVVSSVQDTLEQPQYFIYNAGVEQLSYRGQSKQFRTDTMSTGAVFPLLLADFPTGMAWFNFMAANSRVQTPYGTVEAFNSAGSIAPLLTWNTKITVALAMIDGATQYNSDNCDGNVASHIATYLKRDGVYDQFFYNTQSYYNLAPGIVTASSIPFAMPYNFVNVL